LKAGDKLVRSGEDKSFVLWFTGLSGAGKTTLADKVYDCIAMNGHRVEKLDGDMVRSVFPSTGFGKADRDAHIKRVGFLASLLEKHGVIVIASFISPYKEIRQFVRDRCRNFIEIYVSASLEECERRDPKGLYKKARAGEIKNFTGIDDPYEAPVAPELIVDTETQTVEESFSVILDYLERYVGEGVVPS
jgi:adenylylsulfate kinase